MRRADRLFQIILFLGRGRVLTAQRLAQDLEVSERTIYRDVADLIASGAPIEGAAGVGYRLRPGYQVPPLMFDREELEALALGASMVRAWADSDLARAADRALARVDAVLPDRLRRARIHDTLLAPACFVPPTTANGMGELRRAIDLRLMARLHYCREDGESSRRVIWPLGLIFWGAKWTLGAWCELRDEFRTFRLDRIESLDILPSQFPDMPGRRLKDYITHASGE